MSNNTKQEFINNQKIVATSLSKIIKKKNTEEIIEHKLSENNNVDFDKNNARILRGLYDFKSLNIRFPGYGWEKNAGYGVEQHKAAIYKLGVNTEHRRSFKPIYNILCM